MTETNERHSGSDMEKVIYRFSIKGNYYGAHTFPSLNDYLAACKKGPAVGAKMKRDYQMIASNSIRRALKRQRIRHPVIVRYTFHEPDARRDPSNIASFAVKVIEDALQVCGVLPNDNSHWIKGYAQDFEYGRRAGIDVEIEEV